MGLTRMQRRKALWRATRGEGRPCLVRWQLTVRGVVVRMLDLRVFCASRGLDMPQVFRVIV